MSDPLRTAIEALADEWECSTPEVCASGGACRAPKNPGALLRAILATHAPDTDALAERVLRATRFAESMALTERVRGRFDNERAWLDMLILLAPTQPAERIGTSPSSDGPVPFADERDTPTQSGESS